MTIKINDEELSSDEAIVVGASVLLASLLLTTTNPNTPIVFADHLVDRGSPIGACLDSILRHSNLTGLKELPTKILAGEVMSNIRPTDLNRLREHTKDSHHLSKVDERETLCLNTATLFECECGWLGWIPSSELEGFDGYSTKDH